MTQSECQRGSQKGLPSLPGHEHPNGSPGNVTIPPHPTPPRILSSSPVGVNPGHIVALFGSFKNIHTQTNWIRISRAQVRAFEKHFPSDAHMRPNENNWYTHQRSEHCLVSSEWCCRSPCPRVCTEGWPGKGVWTELMRQKQTEPHL